MLLALAGAAACALLGSAEASAHGGNTRAKPDAARGLLYRGLEPGSAGGRCEGAYQFRRGNGKIRCTHGPDPAPEGIDVRHRRSTAVLRAAADAPTTASAAAAGAIQCIGDGASGKRVQAVYAYPAGGVDRYAEIAPLIRGWAADVDGEIDASAAETGGTRHVRYVTTAECQLAVAKVALSAAAVGDFPTMASDLAAMGYNRDDRKYLVWVDANVYCGIADLWLDDSREANNLNNGAAGVGGMFARIDNGCWGGAEKHELVHNLGGVQNSAPNSSGYGHCTDESDDMCYDDDGAGPVVMRAMCPLEHERLLDCNHDDYFHTSPPSGSYLATHWNTASSSFLEGGGSDTTTPAVAAPTLGFAGTAGKTLLPVTFSWSASDESGIASYALAERIDGGDYADLGLTGPSVTSLGRRLAPGRTYGFRVTATDSVDNVASAETSGIVPRVRQESARSLSYSGTWRRAASAHAMGGYVRYATTRGARASTTFTGRAFAWVARLGPGGGKAHLYVDGRYATTVNLYSATSRHRRIVFSRTWPEAEGHSVFVWVAGTAGRPRVFVDAFLVVR